LKSPATSVGASAIAAAASSRTRTCASCSAAARRAVSAQSARVIQLWLPGIRKTPSADGSEIVCSATTCASCSAAARRAVSSRTCHADLCVSRMVQQYGQSSQRMPSTSPSQTQHYAQHLYRMSASYHCGCLILGQYHLQRGLVPAMNACTAPTHYHCLMQCRRPAGGLQSLAADCTLMSPRLGLNRMWVLPKSSGGPPPLPAAAAPLPAASAAGAAPPTPFCCPAGAPLAAAPLAAAAPTAADVFCCLGWPAGASCCRRGRSSVSSATLSRRPWSSKHNRWESTSSKAARFLRRQVHTLLYKPSQLAARVCGCTAMCSSCLNFALNSHICTLTSCAKARRSKACQVCDSILR
jgi:hypothetical protein